MFDIKVGQVLKLICPKKCLLSYHVPMMAGNHTSAGFVAGLPSGSGQISHQVLCSSHSHVVSENVAAVNKQRQTI